MYVTVLFWLDLALLAAAVVYDVRRVPVTARPIAVAVWTTLALFAFFVLPHMLHGTANAYQAFGQIVSSYLIVSLLQPVLRRIFPRRAGPPTFSQWTPRR